MIEPNPLVARVDALLASHRHADDDVPVLTESVEPREPEIEAERLEALAAGFERAVLGRLLVELDPALEQRLAPKLATLFEQTLRGLREELASSVRELVRAAVVDAVQRELALRRKPEDAAGEERV
ncbi:MAG: hypothetical protein HY017_22190 [Betaproteobacteria bacterium]|nr:hypothetical protein [Betaproteobacteria bacterium]